MTFDREEDWQTKAQAISGFWKAVRRLYDGLPQAASVETEEGMLREAAGRLLCFDRNMKKSEISQPERDYLQKPLRTVLTALQEASPEIQTAIESAEIPMALAELTRVLGRAERVLDESVVNELASDVFRLCQTQDEAHRIDWPPVPRTASSARDSSMRRK